MGVSTTRLSEETKMNNEYKKNISANYQVDEEFRLTSHI